MKDFVLSYDKNMSCLNNIDVSQDIKISVLYTHFMKNSENTWNIVLHSHFFNELHIVLKGNCRMNLENRDISLSENEYILIPSGTEHSFKECSEDFFRFSVAFDIIHEKNQTLVPELSVLPLNERCVSYIENILQEYEENKTGCRSIAEAITGCLLIEILRLSDVFCLQKTKPCTNSCFYEALQFIDNSLSHKITSKDVADKVFLSVRQLNRIFSVHLNMTVMQYIRERKLYNIKEYLEKTDLNIKEIAFLNGFDNESSFCKFFKKETGISPVKYRLNVKKN